MSDSCCLVLIRVGVVLTRAGTLTFEQTSSNFIVLDVFVKKLFLYKKGFDSKQYTLKVLQEAGWDLKFQVPYIGPS